MDTWKTLYDQRRLEAPQTFFWERKPPEELYDLETNPDAVAPARRALRERLADESASVRVIAAWALAAHGDADDLAPALAALRELAPPDRNGPHISLLALNAIDALGPKAASLRDSLSTMARQDPASVPRVAEYVPRLLDHILRNP